MKLKQMYERAGRESFTHRFYKQSSGRNLGEAGGASESNENESWDAADGRFKQVEWFTAKNAQEAPTQVGALELAAPILPR